MQPPRRPPYRVHESASSPNKASAKSQDVRYTVEHDSETEINEVPLTDELIESFVDFLEKHNVELKFFSGAWQNFPTPDQPYDVILTSETVYELDNLEYLTSLLERAAAGHLSGKHDQLTLVACKRVYFGVGGGEIAFKHSVEKKRADVENIWNSGSGVERTVMKVNWAH
jgi:protein-histidine N-methyltransferase